MAATTEVTFLQDILYAFRRSQVLFALVDLKAFDLLSRRGPSTVETISNELQTNLAATERLLNAAVNLKLLLLDNEGKKYRNSSAVERYLTEESEASMVALVEHNTAITYSLFGKLSHGVRSGKPTWQEAFGGRRSVDVFESEYATPEDKFRFTTFMHTSCAFSSEPLVSAFDLSGFRHLVDVGGATGHTTVTACRRYNNLSATVVELGSVIPTAKEFVLRETGK